MLKRVGIQTLGSSQPPQQGFVVTPETTAQELLTRANLKGLLLCPSDTEPPFGATETIYDKVGDNSVLFAYREAQAGH